MAQDGQEPPHLGDAERAPVGQPARPKLSIIHGGGAGPRPLEGAGLLARTEISAEGRARLFRAQKLLGAERSFLFVWNDTDFALSEAAVCGESGGEPVDPSVMWSLLDRITSQRTALVMAGTNEQPADAMMSGVTPPLRMAIGVPIIGGEELLGVACFDKRIHRGQFVESDVRAARTIVQALGFTADGLQPLLHGKSSPGRQPTAPEISASLHDSMCPFDADAGGLRVQARLATPRLTEASFWHRQLLPNGSARLILCRLVNGPAASDLLVARSLACYRAMTLLADTGAHEQLCALPLEIERLSNEPYTLHAMTAHFAPDGSCTVWNAGNAQVTRIEAQGGIHEVVARTKPFSPGVRETANADATLRSTAQLLCTHGAEDQAPSAALAWLRGEPVNSPKSAGASVWLIGEHA
jgi:hypothetical protein